MTPQGIRLDFLLRRRDEARRRADRRKAGLVRALQSGSLIVLGVFGSVGLLAWGVVAIASIARLSNG